MTTELLYLLIGAGLTMAAQTTIQLRVAPRAEARKRREDRWERDVLTLGELLSAELPDRANEARSAQSVLQGVIHELKNRGVEPDLQQETERELSEEARRAVKHYQALAKSRLTWLSNRIVGVDPQNVDLEKFILLNQRYSMTSIVCTFYARPVDDFDQETFEQNWSKERQLREELMDVVERLIHNRRRDARRGRGLRHDSWSSGRQLGARSSSAPNDPAVSGVVSASGRGTGGLPRGPVRRRPG